MSRPVIVPAMLLAIAVIGLAGAYTTHRGEARARRLRNRAARDDSVRSRVVARRDSEVAAQRTASASACPRELQDVSDWEGETVESLPVVVPLLPDFEVDREVRGASGRISFRSSDGEGYSVFSGPRAVSLEEWPQYELVAECADLADVMPGTIQTARDKGPGVMKAVVAAYRLPDGQFVSFRGATRDVQRQAQLVAAAHHMRLKR
jgi:hypothetical protein